MSDGTWMVFYYNPDGAREILNELEKLDIDGQDIPKLKFLINTLEKFIQNGNCVENPFNDD
ncbi:MAG: hypothetical protein ACXAD7_19470 [Candidatus Kariarchaeaceae archaeon]|jgi:hypothetical protein